jgi:hypothetical protein
MIYEEYQSREVASADSHTLKVQLSKAVRIDDSPNSRKIGQES